MKSWLIALAAVGAALLAAGPSSAMARSVSPYGVTNVRLTCTPSGRCYRMVRRYPAVRYAHRHVIRAVPILDAPRPGLRFAPMYGYAQPYPPAPAYPVARVSAGCGPYTCGPAYSYNYSAAYGYAPTQWGGATVGIGFGF
jgi:hypothetical protein